MKDETEFTQKATEKTKVQTDYRTLVFLVTVAAGIGVMWNDLKRDIRDVKAESGNCAQVEDMTRFATQLQALNPSVRVPRRAEFMHGAQVLTQQNERQ